VSTVVVTASWPVVVLVCPPIFEPRWVERLGTSFEDVFARRTEFALVTDTSAVKAIPSARERKLLGEWANRPDQLALQKKYNVGSSTIVKNALMRGTLQALYWLWTPAAPQHASRDFDDAWGWCLGMLEKRGVALPSPAGELRRAAERDMAKLHVEASQLTPS
jgi:hypothetical protein